MKALIKQIILEFHHEKIPIPVFRKVNFSQLPENIRKAHVFVGMRRSGKTWLMYQHIHERMQHQHPIEKMLYVNFEDDRLFSFKVENFQDVLLAYFELYPQYANDPSVHFYFDEIHLVSGWEKFIRRLLDKENMSIYITGSSAKMLSTEIATSLRGRALSTEVFPFSYQEYVSFKETTSEMAYTTKNQGLLAHHFEYYLAHGGFPESLFIHIDFHRELLQKYVNAVVFKDVIERYQVNNVTAVKLFLLHCLQNLSAPLSITKVFNTLKSQGASISKNSLYDYLTYFEEAYLLFAITIYDLSLRKRQINPKKIYAIDPGVLHAYAIHPEFTQGPVFENVVYLELRRRYSEIYYYKTVTGKEIDFLVLMPNGLMKLYQACVTFTSAKTQEREVMALVEARKALGAVVLTIITIDIETTIQFENTEINVIPFWKWALSHHS